MMSIIFSAITIAISIVCMHISIGNPDLSFYYPISTVIMMGAAVLNIAISFKEYRSVPLSARK